MNATVELHRNIPDSSQQVAVPLSAVSIEGDKKYVWVVEQQSMTISKRFVDVLDGVGELVTVIGGLDAGEKVVAAGAVYLSEGMTVSEWK
jgi:multidrug efflux pump subunit AcrA (membrane-fusion protein)